MKISIDKEFIRDNIALGFQYLASALVPILITPILIDTWGLVYYGQIMTIISLGFLFSKIVQFGISTLGVVLAKDDELTPKSATLIKLPLFIVCCVLLINSTTNNHLIIVVLILLFFSLINPIPFLQAKIKFKLIAYLSIIGVLSNITLVYLVKYKIINIEFLYYSLTIGFIPISVYGFYLLIIDTVKIVILKKTILRIVKFQASQILSQLYLVGGTWLISFFYLSSSVGVYAGLNKIYTALITVSSIAFTAVLPRLVDNSKGLIKSKWYLASLGTSILIFVPLFLLLILLDETVLTYFFKNNYELYKYYYYWAIMTVFPTILNGSASNLLLARGNIGLIFLHNLGILLFVTFSIYVDYFNGILSWYIGMFFAQLLSYLIYVWYSRKLQ